MPTYFRDGFRFEYPSHSPAAGDWVDIATPGGTQLTVPGDVLAEFFAAWHTAKSKLTAAPDGSFRPPAGWCFLDRRHLNESLDGRRCFYRTGRGSRAEPQWDALKPGTVLAVAREYDVPATHRSMTRYWRRGEPSEVGVRELYNDWVVYTPDDLDESGDGVLWLGDGVAERGDYLLQILLPAT